MHFPICRVTAECNMSWTLKSTGGDLVGHNGETFAIVFRGSPSLLCIREDELAQQNSPQTMSEAQGCTEFNAIG